MPFRAMSPTKKQNQVFDALLFLIEKGENPTVRELGAIVGLSAPATVLKHLRALEEEGWISLSGKSRGIRVLRRPDAAAAFGADGSRRGGGGTAQDRGVPVVGRIAAGRPIEAVANRSDSNEGGGSGFPEISIDPRIFAGSGDVMALRVSGDSMIGAGILDGDYVIIRRQAVVDEGEIAAVEIEGEVTLKRWGNRPGALEAVRLGPVRLIAANERFAPIEITAGDHKEVRVLGKYVGLVRGELSLL